MISKKVISSIVFILLLLAIFNVFLENFFSPFSYFDELLLLIAVLFLLGSVFFDQSTKLNIYLLLTILAVLIVNFFYYRLNPDAIVQAFLHFKLFIFFVFFDKIFKAKQVEKILKIIFYITLTGLFINIVLGSHFNNIIGDKVSYRNDLLRYPGFNGHPNNIAIIFSIYGLIVYNHYNKFYNRNFSFGFYCIIFFLLLYLTGSRTSIIIIPIIYFYHIVFQKATTLLKIFTPIVLVVGIFFFVNSSFYTLTASNFSMFSQGSSADLEKYTRGLMIISSFKLASDHFPYGSGLATFGTVLSTNSSAYKEADISNNYYVKNMLGIYDSNFASILGELGLIGIILILFLVKLIYNRIPEKAKFFSLIILLYILILSLSYPVFQNSPPAITLALLLVYLKNYTINKNFDDDELQQD